ncbi:hypothetical protein Tco_0845269 [Tanacetum coccineum]
MARRGRRELRRLSGILWKVGEGLGSPWKLMEDLEASCRRLSLYFLDGLQGWAKTELKRRRVQDLSTAIAHAKALIDFSTRRESSKPKDQKVNQEKGGGEKNAQPKSNPCT